MTKEEKIKIYTELFKNTRNNTGKITLDEAINNVRNNRINKLDKFIERINLNITGFGIEVISDNELNFIKYEKNGTEESILEFKLKDEGKIKIYDFQNNEVQSIAKAIEISKLAKIQQYYYVDMFKEGNLTMTIIYNLNIRTHSQSVAHEWTLNQESNCHPIYVKEINQIQLNEDIYLTPKNITYSIDLGGGETKPISREEFIESLNILMHSADILLFRRFGSGVFRTC